MHSREACNTFLEELADAIATEGMMKHASAMKTLKTQEYIWCTHQCISWIFDTHQQGAISFVEVDYANGNQVVRATKEEVEQACMAKNEQQFRQANNTSFIKSLLVEDIGYLGIRENAQAVWIAHILLPWGQTNMLPCCLNSLRSLTTCGLHHSQHSS